METTHFDGRRSGKSVQNPLQDPANDSRGVDCHPKVQSGEIKQYCQPPWKETDAKADCCPEAREDYPAAWAILSDQAVFAEMVRYSRIRKFQKGVQLRLSAFI